MIQLYSENNTNYSKNGNVTLTPTVCKLTAKLGGEWIVDMTHPLDAKGRWKYITDEAVIKMPSFNGSQLFRIYQRSKKDSGVVCKLQPIFFDAKGEVFIQDTRPTDMTGQQALDALLTGSRFSGVSDIDKLETAYYVRKNLLECISGKDDNAFLTRWGGEPIYDNFRIIINSRAGADRGLTLRYGMNIPQNGVEEIVDMSSVVTRIYPQGYNGRTYGGYVDSPQAGAYPYIRSASVEYKNIMMAEDAPSNASEDPANIICRTTEELRAHLEAAAQQSFADGADKPKVTLKVKMAMVQNTEQYADYLGLQNVSLGDTVHLYHSRLGIQSTERVIELAYDAITQKVSDVVLGTAQYTYFDGMASSLNLVQSDIVNIKNEQADLKYGLRSTSEESEVTRSYFWTDAEGAHVTTIPMDATQGKNVLIDSDSMDIRNGEDVLASFGENLIELGKGNDEAVISFVNDILKMSLENQVFEIVGEILNMWLSIADSSPTLEHTAPRLQLQQNAYNYRTSAQLMAEDVLITGRSWGSADGSISLDAESKITANGSPVSPYASDTSISGIKVSRQLNMVTMNLNKQVTLVANTELLLGTLPVGYRPASAFPFVAQIAAAAVPNASARGVVYTDGRVTVTCSSAQANRYVYATVNWLTDDSIS